MKIKLAEGSVVLRADDFERGTVLNVGPDANMDGGELFVAWEGGKQNVVRTVDVVLTGQVHWEVIGDPTEVFG